MFVLSLKLNIIPRTSNLWSDLDWSWLENQRWGWFVKIPTVACGCWLWCEWIWNSIIKTRCRLTFWLIALCSGLLGFIWWFLLLLNSKDVSPASSCVEPGNNNTLVQVDCVVSVCLHPDGRTSSREGNCCIPCTKCDLVLDVGELRVFANNIQATTPTRSNIKRGCINATTLWDGASVVLEGCNKSNKQNEEVCQHCLFGLVSWLLSSQKWTCCSFGLFGEWLEFGTIQETVFVSRRWRVERRTIGQTRNRMNKCWIVLFQRGCFVRLVFHLVHFILCVSDSHRMDRFPTRESYPVFWTIPRPFSEIGLLDGGESGCWCWLERREKLQTIKETIQKVTSPSSLKRV